MPDLSSNWLVCYQQLSALITSLEQAHQAEQLQDCLQRSKDINTTLQQLVDDNPGAAMAQLSIIATGMPATVSRAVKCAVLLALWSRL